jgi:hypothetical protein
MDKKLIFNGLEASSFHDHFALTINNIALKETTHKPKVWQVYRRLYKF